MRHFSSEVGCKDQPGRILDAPGIVHAVDAFKGMLSLHYQLPKWVLDCELVCRYYSTVRLQG